MRAWQDQLRESLKKPVASRERLLFEELNPNLAHTPILDRPPTKLRPASVMIAIRNNDNPTVVLTLRSPTMPSHAGQISLPGGTPKEQDADDIATALREMEEEVGVMPEAIDVLGTYGAHYGGLGYIVTPVIGLLDPDARVEACPREVSEAFEVPLRSLIEPDNHVIEQRIFNGVGYDMFAVPVFDTGGEKRNIWGLTAGILRTVSDAYHA